MVKGALTMKIQNLQLKLLNSFPMSSISALSNFKCAFQTEIKVSKVVTCGYIYTISFNLY